MAEPYNAHAAEIDPDEIRRRLGDGWRSRKVGELVVKAEPHLIYAMICEARYGENLVVHVNVDRGACSILVVPINRMICTPSRTWPFTFAGTVPKRTIFTARSSPTRSRR